MNEERHNPWHALRNPYVIAGVVLSAVYVLPIWVSPILPFTDLHAHLSIVAVMRNLAEAGHFQAQTFEWGSFPLPNAFYYVSVYLLSFLFGLTLANQVFLSLYVLAFPLSFLAYLRAFDRDPRLVFFAFPLIYHWNLVLGFIDYSVGLCFLLLALAAAKRYVDDQRRRRTIEVTLWAALLFFTHLQLFFTFLYLATFIFLLQPHSAQSPPRFGRWRRFATLAPALALSVIWIYRSVLAPTSRGSDHRFGSFGDLGAHYHGLMERLERFPSFVMDIFHDSDDTTLLLVLSLLAAASAALRWARARHDAPAKHTLVSHLPEILLGGTLALYLALPMHIRGQALIYCRFAVLACLMAVATLHGRRKVTHHSGIKALLILVIVAAGVHAYHLQRHVIGWTEEIGPFEEVMRSVPAGTYMTYMTGYEGSAHFHVVPMRHLDQYHVIFNEGVTENSFAVTSGRIIRYRPGRPALPYYRRVVPTGDFNRRWAKDRSIARHFQYLLTYYVRPLPSVGLWRLVSKRGRWALYRSTLGHGRVE